MVFVVFFEQEEQNKKYTIDLHKHKNKDNQMNSNKVDYK